MATLDCIMLVEDDDTINFYNQFLIERLQLSHHVVVARNGLEALNYLDKVGKGEARRPQLILLDINMPVMNGFEFIEQYEQLPEAWKSEILVVMLTTSLHPQDMERAQGHPAIVDYVYKPLMEEKLGELVEKHFQAV